MSAINRPSGNESGLVLQRKSVDVTHSSIAIGSHGDVKFRSDGIEFTGLVVEKRWRYRLGLAGLCMLIIVFGIPGIGIVEILDLWNMEDFKAIGLSDPAFGWIVAFFRVLVGFGILLAFWAVGVAISLWIRGKMLRAWASSRSFALPYGDLKWISFCRAKEEGSSRVWDEYNLSFGAKSARVKLGNKGKTSIAFRDYIAAVSKRWNSPIQTLKGSMDEFPGNPGSDSFDDKRQQVDTNISGFRDSPPGETRRSLLERCPHCGADVLFATNVCPSCQKERQKA